MTTSLVPRLFRASVFAGLAALTASNSACAQDQETLIITQALWLSDTCAVDPGATPLAGLTADVYYEGALALGLAVSNNASPNENSNTGLDDSEIQLLDADISLSFTGGGLSTSAYNFPIPTDSIAGGQTQGVLIQIPGDIVASMRETMAANPDTVEFLDIEVVINARKASQVGTGKLGEIKSRAFSFPLEICYNCLGLCFEATDCGGEEGSPTLCPSPTDWFGSCGFPQASSIVAPECASAL